MKNSCNGCRVLRKGCSEDCILRPSLDWIDSDQGQANATVFLAKFYGRAGLMNLLNAGPPNLRQEIYKSLLEEACGRIVNPIHGSVGLRLSGNWQLCEEAMDTVIKGFSITQKEGEQIMNTFPDGDIRHLSKNLLINDGGNQKIKTRKRFKHPAASSSSLSLSLQLLGNEPEVVAMELMKMNDLNRTPSNESIASVETVEASLLVKKDDQPGRVDEMDLKLTLGLNAGLYSQLSALAEIAVGRDV